MLVLPAVMMSRVCVCVCVCVCKRQLVSTPTATRSLFGGPYHFQACAFSHVCHVTILCSHHFIIILYGITHVTLLNTLHVILFGHRMGIVPTKIEGGE